MNIFHILCMNDLFYTANSNPSCQCRILGQPLASPFPALHKLGTYSNHLSSKDQKAPLLEPWPVFLQHFQKQDVVPSAQVLLWVLSNEMQILGVLFLLEILYSFRI